MSLKHKLFGFSFLLVLVLLFLLSALTCIYFYLPTYLRSEIIPEITRKAGISDYSCDVRRIGFSGVDLGSVRIGKKNEPALLIDAVQIDYSLMGLYKKRIKSIILSGMEVFCEYKNRSFSIRQSDLKTFLAGLQPSGKTVPSFKNSFQTISIGRLEIRNAVAVLTHGKNRIRLPFDLKIVSSENGSGVFERGILSASLSCYARGQEIVITARVDPAKGEIILGVNAKNFHIERFGDFVRQVPGLAMIGDADINGKASLHINPFGLSSASASFLFHNIEIVYNDFKVKNLQYLQKKGEPVKIEIRRSGEKEWRIYGTGFSAISPIPMKVSDIKGHLRFSYDAVRTSGDFTVAFKQFVGRRSIRSKVLDPLKVTSHYSVKLEKNGQWEFKVKNKARDTSINTFRNYRFKFNNFDGVTAPPIFNIFGKGKHAEGSATYNVILPYIRVKKKFGSIETRGMSLKGKLRFGKLLRKGCGLATFVLKTTDTDLKLETATIKIPDASIAGELWEGKDHISDCNGVFKFKNTSITESSVKAKIRGIDGIVPLRWPLKGSGQPGKYSIKEIQWKKRNLGFVEGTIQQKDSALFFKGKHSNSIFPNLSIILSGKLAFLQSNGYEAGINFKIKNRNSFSEMDLGRFSPSAKGVTFNGELALDGGVTFGNSGMRSSLKANIKNANIMLQEKKASIEGIQASLVMTDLFKLRSAPAQKFYFKRASLGGLNADNGTIEFQVESADSFLIEKSRFSWCDGNVYTQAMRISPGINDYNLTLYCDRLKLAMILEQLGAVNAEGVGTVNGWLPIHLKNGKIRFSDSFLFSTPGEGGKIHISGTEMLTAGIPTNTPQYVQIELAREALKDYDYKWAKLNLMTEGENVVLRLQLNGKPARRLPFIYDKKFGGFAKVEVGSKGSIFQGISLDVNFRVPLDKVLYYKDIFNMIK